MRKSRYKVYKIGYIVPDILRSILSSNLRNDLSSKHIVFDKEELEL